MFPEKRGVTAIAYSANGSFIYTAGVDGMVCKIKAHTGMILGTLGSPPKQSHLSTSFDGKMLATTAGQLRTFICCNNKRIQKNYRHPSYLTRYILFYKGVYYILMFYKGALYMGNKSMLKVDSKVSIVMDQMLRLLYECGLSLEDADIINSDSVAMKKLLLEINFCNST
ncbi:Transducin family protein / WD-40 repeat family protein [Carex littledalei]|uniref:Transducin family protein / WD-40 repeat family protein n=1 Tax=Carex littledalei TaxID=544730 RepID=A0A833R1W2_9POAL|nr:Transducin family protein / WD-40 repeat family protein [Carex littledalei]